MMLNSTQIVDRSLISQEFDQAALHGAGYDLRISKLMIKDEKGELQQYTDDINLKPQGIVAVISKEWITLPKDICAYAHVKTSLSREGVLAINAGVVDPGWSGPLSSVLLNFGESTYCLRSGDTFIRLTFHKVPDSELSVQSPRSREEYEESIKIKFKKRLTSSFMNIDDAAKLGAEKLRANLRLTLFVYIPLAALMLAGLTFLVNFGTLKLANWTTPSEMVLTRAKALTEGVDRHANQLEQQNKELRTELDQLQREVELLKKK
jgi:deoxycytidine triphosphate deaminase